MSDRRAETLAHFLRLYDDPGFGPDYVRHAVRVYIEMPGCPCRDMGHRIKNELDKRSEDHGSDAAKTAERLPGAAG